MRSEPSKPPSGTHLRGKSNGGKSLGWSALVLGCNEGIARAAAQHGHATLDTSHSLFLLLFLLPSFASLVAGWGVV